MRISRVISCGALALAISGGSRYRRDLASAETRLASFSADRAKTRFGPIPYTEFGAGPPVLMVHGIVGGYDPAPSWRTWVPDGYRLLAPARFGYLGSPMPEVVTPDLQAEAYGEMFDSLGVDRCCVFSFSAGSTSAVAFALGYPERVTGLVLACPNSPHPEAPNLPPKAFAPLLFSQPAFWAFRLLYPRGLEQLAGRPPDYPMDAEAQRDVDEIVDGFFPMAPRAAGVIYDAYVGNPAIADLPVEEVSVPSLVIHAQDDPLAPYDDAKAMAERIPGSRFVSLTRGGHVLMHRDDRALSEVARFLEANSDPAPG